MPFIHLYSLKHCVFLFVVQYSKFLSYLCETSSYSLFFHSLSFYRSRIPLFFIPLLSYHHSLRYNHWLQQISKTVLRAFVHKFDDDEFQRGQREGRDLAAHKILALFRGIYVRSTLYKAMRETAKRLRKLLQQSTLIATAATATAADDDAATAATGVGGLSTGVTIVPDSDGVPLSSSSSIASTTSVHSASVHSTGSEGLIPKKKPSKKKGVKGTKKWLRRAQVGE